MPLLTIANNYQHWIVDTGRQPELFLLVSFLLAFGFIRMSTHMIRSPRFNWWPGNVQVDGTHIHHLVWGILLLLVVGYAGIALEPSTPWREVLAVLFGIGAGLTLDEFALWLNLKDVYWSDKGRQSIDAVIVATILGFFALFGIRIWVDLADEIELAVRVGAAGSLTIGILLAIVNVLKGKYRVALLGLVVPLLWLVGAFRLAKPGSLWARSYGEGRRGRAEQRFVARTR